jgi:hypothetical protein
VFRRPRNPPPPSLSLSTQCVLLSLPHTIFEGYILMRNQTCFNCTIVKGLKISKRKKMLLILLNFQLRNP